MNPKLQSLIETLRADRLSIDIIDYKKAINRARQYKQAQELCKIAKYPFYSFCKEIGYSRKHIYNYIRLLKFEDKEYFWRHFSTRRIMLLAALPEEIIKKMNKQGFKLPSGKFYSFEDLNLLNRKNFNLWIKQIQEQQSKDISKKLEPLIKKAKELKKVFKEAYILCQKRNFSYRAFCRRVGIDSRTAYSWKEK